MSNYLFESDEEFKFFMGNTLAYNNMQNMVSKLVSFIKPQYMVEFGSGSGATSIRLAKENPQTSIVAVDLREKMVGIGADKSSKNKIKNVTFVNGDLTKLGNFNLKNASLILMMYSFRYIADPVQNKYDFLKDLYDHMSKGSYVIIGETFIDENASKQTIRKQLEDRYYNNSKDIYWANLKGLSKEDVMNALTIQSKHRETTKEQIELGVNRDGIYYISREWMFENAPKIGFEIVLGERLNSLSDTIFVLKK